MEVFWLVGAVIFYMTYFLKPQLLRFDTKTYFKFLAYFLIGSAISVGIRYTLGSFPPLPDLGYGSLLMVGWEDLVFSLALIYLPHHYLRSKRIATTLAVISSLAFAYGHINQGLVWASITLLYPYFISYKGGKKHGYGTVMALHVTYDLLIVSTIHLLHSLKG